MRKKRSKTKYIILGIIFIIMLTFAVFSSTLDENRKLNVFESLIKDTTTSVEKVIFYPFKFVLNKINDYKELKSIHKKIS